MRGGGNPNVSFLLIKTSLFQKDKFNLLSQNRRAQIKRRYTVGEAHLDSHLRGNDSECVGPQEDVAYP